MVTPYWTFADLLAGLKYNVGQSTMPEIAGITQIRKEVAGITFTATLTRTNVGPDYFAYPGWNTEDLQGWWTLASFETVTGASGVRDSQGSQDGTINGNPVAGTFDDLAIGRKRHFLTLDGTGDFVNLGDITALDGATQMSWGARVRVDTITGTDVIVARWSSTNSEKQFLLRATLVGASYLFQIFFATDGVGGQAFGRTTTALSASTWYDILIVYNGGGAADADKLKIYVDGVNQSLVFSGTIPASLQSVTGDVLIGRSVNAVDDFDGDIYDVAYWNSDLPSSEVTTWASDAVTDRIISGLFRLPGTLVTDIMPTKHSYIPVVPRRRRHMNGYKHQIVNQV